MRSWAMHQLRLQRILLDGLMFTVGGYYQPAWESDIGFQVIEIISETLEKIYLLVMWSNRASQKPFPITYQAVEIKKEHYGNYREWDGQSVAH